METQLTATSRWGSVVLIEPTFGAEIFNLHGDFEQKIGNYHHVTTIRLSQMNPLSGNLTYEPGSKKNQCRLEMDDWEEYYSSNIQA